MFPADVQSLPAPLDSRVVTKELSPSFVAALRFGGIPLDFEVNGAEKRLREALLRDGLEPKTGYRWVAWLAGPALHSSFQHVPVTGCLG